MSGRTISFSTVRTDSGSERSALSSHFDQSTLTTGNTAHKSIVVRAAGRVTGMSSNAETLPENILLLNVLRGARKTPLSQKDFQDYLDAEHCGELSRFFSNVEEYEKLVESKSTKQSVDLAMNITIRFIKMDSEDEINISEIDRTKIVSKMDSNRDEAGQDPLLFKKVKNEVIRMLSGDKFQRFLKRQTETNITNLESKRRAKIGSFLLFLAFFTVGIFMWLQCTLPTDHVFTNRLWRLCCLPFVLGGCGFVLSSRSKVCAGLAQKCMKMRDRDFYTNSSEGVEMVQIQDDLARNLIRIQGKKLVRRMFLASLMLMLAIMLVPPGYGIGGISG